MHKTFMNIPDLHPSVKILCLVALAIVIHLSSAPLLLMLGLILGLALAHQRAAGFWKLLRRVRWILIFLILIFAFNTPGEYVMSWPFELEPTYEGVFAGLIQSAKICLMLAGLTLLLATTDRESLITGFYLLSNPLRILKLDPERFAARLWLTLHYVEQAPKSSLSMNSIRNTIFDQLNGELDGEGPELIRLKSPKPSWYDLLVVALLIGAGVYAICA